MFLSFQARRSSAKRSSTSDLTVLSAARVNMIYNLLPYKNSHEFLNAHEILMRLSREKDILVRIFRFS